MVGVWGCAVLGVDPDELNQTLIQFQQNMVRILQREFKTHGVNARLTPSREFMNNAVAKLASVATDGER